ncbi:Dipeptidyl aminopeptidase/acylaminoacyl-peptidase [Elusimicrobium minutum Pei191]|uniref:Dipeptidyl aminopeptidase/acylaminoacyl-peptidase n=1 Tax=Elusimicrobium minutum (strain Pei191) TaxID=445932 RepID=B2KEB7_ELUMP|nr:alpha/beta fold hydrolase [Elusimicrobium minutum]ACC98863.1 Dipeptidyl aminopeptidase/acylaminoacyl-peptidase [Elusimicrobium minutum Pei191]
MNIILIVILILLLACALTVRSIYKQSIQILEPSYKRKPLIIFPDQFKVPFENIRFKTADGVEIKGWFIPNEESSKTIFLLHGWGQNRGDILKNTVYLRDLGFNLVYFDFRAMGESGGKVSSIGYLETKDLEAAIDYMKSTRSSVCKSIGLYGISMGATVAIYVAAKNKEIKCVLSEAAYYSFNRVAARWAWINKKIPYFPVMPLVLYFMRKRLGFDPQIYSPAYNIDGLAGRPVFIIHGRHDSLVPAVNATYLYKKAKEPKDLWIIPGAKHNQGAEVGGEEYKYKMAQFFTKNM